ncbi:response regulator [Halioxenophilus sp. WMMB6]|uniref:response regulator transcription factor n=1 Tax=Halioxenophilus sp. WMMB6 TaxID=3073815 RepID=UPI00295EA5FB|nr:response regulator [Halioxenophilus sp. WMMB6]
MAKLFWVEDQSHWIEKFTPILESTLFDGGPTQLEVYKFAEAAKQRIALMKDEQKPDLAILDAHMNGFDQAGFSVSRALRKKWPELPIIFLSEHSGTEIEEEAITNTDARDFIAKHQRNIEAVLCWRIKAALKQPAGEAAAGQHLVSGSLKIDLETWEVFWKGQRLMNPHNPKRPLAPTPRKILRYLVERSPRPLSTEQVADLLEADLERFSYANYRQHIKTLRTAFDAAEPGVGQFTELCKTGRGIVTFGDAQAYFWKSDQ